MRRIIHVDMDAFYASVEQRNNPALKGKPVIVGGSPNSRGVVAACSYEARKFGIHSAMASSRAYRLCPTAVFVRPDFSQYQEVSSQVHEIFYQYSDLVEPLSLDEAYIDITEYLENGQRASEIAEEIRKKIFEKTNLTASAGVSYNKFIAKIASDYNKPNGITVIPPQKAQAFLDSLLIKKFFGIGKATEKRFHSMGVKTGYDLRQIPLFEMETIFGKTGKFFYNCARGIDDREVSPYRERKSLGKERTFKEDIDDINLIVDFLENIAQELVEYLEKKRLKPRTCTLKVKYSDFELATRSTSPGYIISSKEEIMKNVKELLHLTELPQKKIRLAGISLSNFYDESLLIRDEQLTFDFSL